MRHMPRPAKRAQIRRRARNVSSAAGTLKRHRRDGRRRVGVILESGKRDSIVGNAGIQGTVDGKADLAGYGTRKECGQNTGIREKGTRGRREHSDGNGDAGKSDSETQEKIVRFKFRTSVAHAAAGIGESLPCFGNELPVVRAGFESELEDAESSGVAYFAIGFHVAEGAMILAIGADDEFANAASGVGSAVGRLRGEALVVVGMTVDNHVGVGAIEGLPAQ